VYRAIGSDATTQHFTCIITSRQTNQPNADITFARTLSIGQLVRIVKCILLCSGAKSRPILIDSVHNSCGGDQMATIIRKIRVAFLVRIIVGLLFCAIASAELPEILTLADQTDNDIAIGNISALASPDSHLSQETGCDQAAFAMDHPPSRTQIHPPAQTRSFPRDLLALHSVRRT
jgi:hypothetical protein